MIQEGIKPNKKIVPCRGPKFKLMVFSMLAFVQLLQLFFITAYEDKSRNRFYMIDDLMTTG